MYNFNQVSGLALSADSSRLFSCSPADSVVKIWDISRVQEEMFTNTTLDIDYSQGQRIRLQAKDASGSPAGNIQDSVVTVTIKHRG